MASLEIVSWTTRYGDVTRLGKRETSHTRKYTVAQVAGSGEANCKRKRGRPFARPSSVNKERQSGQSVYPRDDRLYPVLLPLRFQYLPRSHWQAVKT